MIPLAVTLIAMKCKVVADMVGFYTERMSSRDTDDKSLYKHYSLL